MSNSMISSIEETRIHEMNGNVFFIITPEVFGKWS